MKRRGSVFLEAVFYIIFCSIVLAMVFSAVFVSMKAYRTLLVKNDLRENALLAENIIKREISGSSGVKVYMDENMSGSRDEEGYLRVRKIEYNLEDYGERNLKEGRDGYPRMNIEHKRIEKYMDNLYVGKESKYQIGNSVDSMYIRSNNLDRAKKYDFIIRYGEDDIYYINKFSVVVDK